VGQIGVVGPDDLAVGDGGELHRAVSGGTSVARLLHIDAIRERRPARLQQVADTAIVEKAQESRG
jgi:hypothetical protein